MDEIMVFKVAKRDALLFKSLCGFYATLLSVDWKDEYAYIQVRFKGFFPEKGFHSVMNYCKDNMMDVTVQK